MVFEAIGFSREASSTVTLSRLVGRTTAAWRESGDLADLMPPYGQCRSECRTAPETSKSEDDAYLRHSEHSRASVSFHKEL